MAKSTVRKVLKAIFVSANVLVIGLFLLACLCPYLNPQTWWIVGFAGLLVPYTAVLLLFAIIFWLIVKPRLALLSLFVLLAGWRQLSVVFAAAGIHNFNKQPNNKALRVVDWNIQGFNGLSSNREAKKHAREDVAECITDFQPDVICLQEFNHGQASDNISLFTKEYPYYYFSRDYTGNKGRYFLGNIIFSKYPIIDSGKVAYPNAESLIYADIIKGGDTLRVYTTHLQSFKFDKKDYNDIEKIKSQEDKTLTASKNIFIKMKRAFQQRSVQARMVHEALKNCPYPSIICGDFNDVPNSFAYFHIRGDRKDAFLEKQLGIGRTFISLAPTLRIDYILPDKRFDVQQFDLIDENLSDHIMLVADLQLHAPVQAR